MSHNDAGWSTIEGDEPALTPALMCTDLLNDTELGAARLYPLQHKVWHRSGDNRYADMFIGPASFETGLEAVRFGSGHLLRTARVLGKSWAAYT